MFFIHNFVGHSINIETVVSEKNVDLLDDLLSYGFVINVSSLKDTEVVLWYDSSEDEFVITCSKNDDCETITERDITFINDEREMLIRYFEKLLTDN